MVNNEFRLKFNLRTLIILTSFLFCLIIPNNPLFFFVFAAFPFVFPYIFQEVPSLLKFDWFMSGFELNLVVKFSEKSAVGSSLDGRNDFVC